MKSSQSNRSCLVVVISAALSVATLSAPQTYATQPDAPQPASANASMAPVAVTAQSVAPDSHTGSVSDDLRFAQRKWAEINYSTLNRGQKLAALDDLATNIESMRSTQPENVELIIWHGIVLATRAGVDGGMSALKTVKQARNHFATALQIDEYALDGSAHLSIGSLYYQVPPWPIGFGSSKKARFHLTRALEINPFGIDSNFFYAGYLEKTGDLTGALKALRLALKAPLRPGWEAADAGRRAEVLDAIDRINKKTLSG